MYAAPRTVLVFAVFGTLVWGWLGISGFIEGADIWRPVLALVFAILWLVVGLVIWRKSKATLRPPKNSSPYRDRITDNPNGD